MKLTQILTGHAEATGAIRMATSPDFTRNPASAFPARSGVDTFASTGVPVARFDAFELSAHADGANVAAFTVVLEATHGDPADAGADWMPLATVALPGGETEPFAPVVGSYSLVRVRCTELILVDGLEPGGVKVTLACRCE